MRFNYKNYPALGVIPGENRIGDFIETLVGNTAQPKIAPPYDKVSGERVKRYNMTISKTP